MQGQNSMPNIIAALASFFVPGLGQLIQGRLLRAAFHFIAAGVLWIVFLGWIFHIWSVWDAARWSPTSN